MEIKKHLGCSLARRGPGSGSKAMLLCPRMMSLYAKKRKFRS